MSEVWGRALDVCGGVIVLPLALLCAAADVRPPEAGLWNRERPVCERGEGERLWPPPEFKRGEGERLWPPELRWGEGVVILPLILPYITPSFLPPEE